MDQRSLMVSALVQATPRMSQLTEYLWIKYQECIVSLIEFVSSSEARRVLEQIESDKVRHFTMSHYYTLRLRLYRKQFRPFSVA